MLVFLKATDGGGMERRYVRDAPPHSTRRWRLRMLVLGTCLALGASAANAGQEVRNPATEPGSIATPLSLKQISPLDQKAFERSLRQLRQAMEQPGTAATADRETLAAICGKLRRADESTPDYWPTVLRFLQFASSRLARHAPPSESTPRALSEILMPGLMRGMREEGKTILLDDGSVENGEFTNCRIIFSGNPVRMKKALFRNCVFEIPAADPPSPYIKKVSRVLLASSLELVSVATLSD